MIDGGDRRHGCAVHRVGSGDVSFVSGTAQTMAWSMTSWDTDGYRNPSYPSRMINSHAETRRFTTFGTLSWATTANAGLSRAKIVQLTEFATSIVPFPADNTYGHRHAFRFGPLPVASGAYWELDVLQKTGANLNFVSATSKWWWLLEK